VLKVPAFDYFEDLRVTVYQDDTIFWKFYVVPDYLSIRKDAQDNPVFLLIKYAFGDQDREDTPDLPRGGGYLAFDVEMRVAENAEEVLREKLQKRVAAIWTRMKDLAESHHQSVEGARLRAWYTKPSGRTRENRLNVHDLELGLGGDGPEAPPGDAPPIVQIARPTWTEGTFEVSAPQSAHLVTNEVTSGPLSLTGTNVASVNIETTAPGATFMHKTLVNRDGTGGSDLTPIQVRFDLKFWARIPPIKLRVEADSRSLYLAIESMDHDYDDHNCGKEDQIRHYETKLEAAVEANLIKVSFDTGTLDLDSDFIQEIRSTAMNLVNDMVTERFFQPKEPSEDDGENYEDAKKDIFILKAEGQIDYTSIDYIEEITSIQEWAVHPQGTMQSFFAGMSAAEVSKFVRVVDLDDPFFNTLGLQVNAFANWDEVPIAFVEVQVHYSGRDENGDQVEKTESFTLNKDAPSAEWDPSLIGKKRSYQWRYRIAFTGREAGEWSRFTEEVAPTLNISVPDAGQVHVQILAGSVDFQQTVEQAQVRISYADTAAGVEEQSAHYILSDGQRAQLYKRDIYTEWDKPYTYAASFRLKDGQVIEGEEQRSNSRQLLINAPLFDTLDVRLVPAGDWSDVVQTVVSLQYEDAANDYRSEQAFQLRAIDEFKTWSVVLRDTGHRDFRYKWMTTFKNGEMTETDWQGADGDQAIAVMVESTPKLIVDIIPATIDFKATPVVTCTFAYQDARNGVHETRTFAFDQDSASTSQFMVALADSSKRSYRYSLTYHTSEGGRIERPEVEEDATVLVVPRVDVPAVRCILVPMLVNFVETPVVEVTLNYADANSGIADTQTFILTSKTDQNEYRLPVNEDSSREYTLNLTYYAQDGQAVTRDPVVTDRTRFVVPRYIPA